MKAAKWSRTAASAKSCSWNSSKVHQ